MICYVQGRGERKGGEKERRRRGERRGSIRGAVSNLRFSSHRSSASVVFSDFPPLVFQMLIDGPINNAVAIADAAVVIRLVLVLAAHVAIAPVIIVEVLVVDVSDLVAMALVAEVCLSVPSGGERRVSVVCGARRER